MDVVMMIMFIRDLEFILLSICSKRHLVRRVRRDGGWG